MADAKSYEPARDFRANLNPPEARLWLSLRGRRLDGLKFRRQHPIGPYILDFYCAAAKLAVEVDGAIHDVEDQIRHDQRRTTWLAQRGVRVIRLRPADVKDEIEGVLGFIGRVALARLGTESPPPSRP